MARGVLVTGLIVALAFGVCPGTALAQSAPAVSTLHVFTGSGGANPYAALMQASDGRLYGATLGGGAGGYGTIFRIDASGAVTTLHAFTDADGSNPSARLLQAIDGTLVGSTLHGGPNGVGTIYKLTLSGTFTTLHAFNDADGAYPEGGLIQAGDGNFYGTTTNGGASGNGTVYRLTPSGTLTTLHSFSGSDGALPLGPLVQAADGNLYGTTYMGGPDGGGTVFKLAAGTVTTAYSFNFTDGAYPVAGLLAAADGNLYGTTTESGPDGGGTIFKLTLSGTLTTLHGFNYTDGAYPEAAVIQGGDGTLYGTTYEGGTNGLGTIFKLDASGTLTTLHAFAGPDGANPYAHLLLASNGRLYGTAQAGGPSFAGVVFRVTLGPPPVLLVTPATGVFGGTTTLTAALTSDGLPVSGASVGFTVGATTAGTAVTNGAGVATLAGVSLAGLAVGSHPGVVHATFGGDLTFAAVNGSAGAQISQAVPVITWGTPADIVYGTALGSAQLNATANVPGSFVYTPPGGTVLAAGAAQTLSVTFTPTDSSSYSTVSATVLLNVVHVNRPPVLVNPGSQVNTDIWGYAQAVAADGPMAYWRLGETAGTSAADSAGANPGTVFGGVTLGQAGALADGHPAMRFNGSTGYVRVGNSPAMPLTGDLTIELWLNVPLAARQTLISKDYLHEFELTLETSGKLNFYQGNGVSYGGTSSAAGAVTANAWQHVVVSRVAATNTIRFYVNGIAKGSGTYVTAPTASTRPISIGRSDGGTQYVNGWLDEVALYPAALSPAQVAAHYALRTSVGTPTSVVLPLAASDPDGDGLTYGATGLPSGLTVNATTGVISGTLTLASVGTHQVTATASDGALANSQTFTWTVTHVNRHPTLTSPGPQTSVENASVSLGLVGSDPDGDALTYSATGLPAPLTLNATTGLIAGTLSFTSAGTYVVTATVSDGSLVSASQTFTWTVANTNRAPVLGNPGAQTHSDTSGYAQAVLADAPAAYWRLGETAGGSAADSAGANPGTVFGGVTLGQAGALADGNPAMRFNGSTGYVRAANTAGVQLAADLSIELWVNASLATRQTLISKDYLHEFELTLETSGKLTLYQGNGTTYEGTSVFGAVTANTWQHVVVTRTASTKTIRFYVNGILKGSGIYVTVPTTSTNAVSIGRSEGGAQYVNGRLDEVALYPAALSATQVAAHYALRTSIGTPTVVALQLIASDPDGDALTYGATGLPSGLTVNAATGLISGTLTPASAGIHQVTATASDGNLSSSQTFTWTVTHVNRNPTLTGPGTQASAENASVSLQLVASDPDGDALSYSATGLPASLTLNTATGVIAGTLSFTSAGTYVVTAAVSDGSLASASQTFTWTVANTNRAPALTNPGAQTHSETSGYAQAVLADAPADYWRLGETTGTSAVDRTGANPGTVFGGVTLGQAGALADGNPAMLFNGSTGYMRTANSTVPLAGDLTIELWLNVSLATRQTLISKDYLHEFELTLETSGKLTLYQGNGVTYEGTSVFGAVTANTWQHVVVTRTAATKTMRFYVNGILKGSGVYTIVPTSSTTPISIGRSDGGTQYVNGRLDEVALYPASLSPAQVAAHYALRTSVGTPTVVALQLIASDPDGDPLTYSAAGLPPTVTVNAATGLISGTLSAGSAGSYSVTVTASDGVLSTSQTFTWTVTHLE